MNRIFIPDFKSKVFVRCFTYNHAAYIREALQGFAIQESTFPFQSVVVDDSSTDGEKEVLEEYIRNECKTSDIRIVDTELALIKICTHKLNPNCEFYFYFLKKNLWGTGLKMPLMKPWRECCEYEALCEGDDYWTDPKKLQREVDFLDNNTQYSMMAENGLILNTITHKEYPFSEKPSREIVKYEELLRGRKFPTAGVILRTSVVSELYELDCPKHDTMIWCWMLSKGKIYYSDKISSVYRRGMQGVCESTEHYKFGLQMEEWDLAIMKMFNINKRYIYNTIARSYKYSMVRALKYRCYKSAYKSALKIIKYLIKCL